MSARENKRRRVGKKGLFFLLFGYCLLWTPFLDSPAIYPPCSSCSSHGLCSQIGITAPGSSYALLCSQCYTIFVMMLHNPGAGSTYYFCYSGSKMRGWVTCAALVAHGEAGGGTPLLLRPVFPAPGSRQRNYQARYPPLGTNGSITKIQFILALTWVSPCFDNHIDQVSWISNLNFSGCYWNFLFSATSSN